MEKSKFRVRSNGVGEVIGTLNKGGSGWKVSETKGDVAKLDYVIKASEKVFNYLDRGEGMKLSIHSEIPLGSGLGSSSAVTTAVSAAIALVLGEKLEEDEIANLAFQVEKDIQGDASRAGVSVAAHGGFLKVEGDSFDELRDLPNPNIVIGYTGKHANTGELVKKVREKKENKPEIYESMINAIGQSTRSGIQSLRENDFEKVGVLMNVNQALLEGLGVSSPLLSELIKATRNAGALGAKITGAGGGGCMISLSNGESDGIKEAIKKKTGTPIETKVGNEGLKF